MRDTGKTTTRVAQKLCLLLCAFIALVASGAGTAGAQQKLVERDDLRHIFEKAGIQGTFVLLDARRDRLVSINGERAGRRFIPASTFKIANTLIALETGAVRDVDEIIAYGGRPQPIKAWERDMSLRDAIVISNVPVFQTVARRVGVETYRKWLRELGYSNGRTGDQVTRFWLSGPLEISAVEQVRFLSRLAARQLSVSPHAQAATADIIRLEQKNGRTLYAKTGWTTAPHPDIGWFVGWVRAGDEIYSFALNMDMRYRSDAKLRKALALRFLNVLDIY